MSDIETHLLALAAQQPVFAVLDGAHFADLPVRLRSAGFNGRPLFTGGGSNDPMPSVVAPWIVPLDEQSHPFQGRRPDATIPALLNIIADRPAAVFWACTAGLDALYRHLRSLNVILYPKTALTTYEAQFVERPEVGPLFRHADANVMAQVAPSLEPPNRARLFGPAQSLACVPAPAWRSNEVHVEVAGDAYPPAGQLRLTQAEAAAIAKRYREGVAHLIAEGYHPLDRSRVHAAVMRAAQYEIDMMEDLEVFVKLDLTYGASFEKERHHADALAELKSLTRPPDTRLAHASEICRNAGRPT